MWSIDHPFPIDIDYMISDTLELLRPKMSLSSSLEEATKQVADLEREVLVKLGTTCSSLIKRAIASELCVYKVSNYWSVENVCVFLWSTCFLLS